MESSMNEEIMHLSVSMQFAFELTFGCWFVSRLSHDGRRFWNFWGRWFVDRPGIVAVGLHNWVCLLRLTLAS